MSGTVQRTKFPLIPAILFVLALTARLAPGPRTIDDAYITFRYVHNILAGNGFVYNPGEHVLGTTTPLYTFLLTGLGFALGGADADLPRIAWLINAFADSITCLLITWLGIRIAAPRAGLATAFVWAIAPFSVTFAIGGLETSVFILILIAGVLAYQAGKPIGFAFLAALALLARPDALIMIGPIFLSRAATLAYNRHSKWSINLGPMLREKKFLVEALVFLIPVLSWGILATLYFGSPLPHSITAKSLAYRLPSEAAFVRLLQHYSVPFMENEVFGIWWLAVGMILYPFLFLIGARAILRKNKRAWAWVIYPWLYFGVYALANPLIFRWYLTPPLPIYLLVLLAGLDALIMDVILHLRSREGRISTPNTTSWRYQLISYLFILVIPFTLTGGTWVLSPDHGSNRPAPEMAWYRLELLYRQASDLLAPEIAAAPQLPTLAAGDVGVLGYYTTAKILDTVGLNSPVSTRFYPLDPAYYVINYAIPPDLIINERPEYVVILEVYGREGLLKDARFNSAYRLRTKLPTDIYGSDGMLIFQLK